MVALVLGAWHLDRLDPGKSRVDIGIAPPPPPAESGSPAAPKQTFKQKQTKKIVKELVVPPEVKPPADTKPVESADLGTGTGNGQGTGSGSGEGDGDGSGDSPCKSDCGEAPKPLPPPPAQQTVAPTALNQLFISGERNIEPNALIKRQLIDEGKQKLTASFKLCLDASGNVTSTKMIKSSSYAQYDEALASGMRGWRYKPYTLDNRGIPVCSVVTFVFQMK